MPVLCEIRLDPVHVGQPLPPDVLLVLWLARPHDLLAAGGAVAELSHGASRCELYVRFPCAVQTLHVSEGATLGAGQPLLSVTADGEAIPEGFRYCGLRVLE